VIPHFINAVTTNKVLMELPNAKQIRYLKATALAHLFDWGGALAEYQYVLDHIGTFTTAAEGAVRCKAHITDTQRPSRDEEYIKAEQDAATIGAAQRAAQPSANSLPAAIGAMASTITGSFGKVEPVILNGHSARFLVDSIVCSSVLRVGNHACCWPIYV
jgi:hypothetical protein